MKYSFESSVRFSEIGEDKRMTLSSVIDYYQDCTNFHSEAIGAGMEHVFQKKRAWMLASWQIIVNRYPKLGEAIVVTTWPYDFKGFYGFRNFTLETDTGELLSYANSLWIYIDLETGSPVRIDEEEASFYECEERMQMEYASRKVPMKKDSQKREPFLIRRHQLDFNHHVNNGQYIQIAQDYLPDGYVVRQMRAEYKKQAVAGSVVVPMVHQEGEVYTVSLCDEVGSPYAVVEFQ